ncbi:MAG: hypothetical protein JL50_01025 [Peptococcaceae bacterium BICA1-7]|nr:MAG: hypothetical protein JL50_01025 [Peptococcaceae bacterium BICA1-7]HBV98028.1 hypothetical protein [Desulfotomaculum sp.]
MIKFKMILCSLTLVLMLFLGQGVALAGYTEYDSGYKGVWSVRDRDTGHTLTNALATEGMDSIVSVTLRYKRVSGQNVECRMYAAGDNDTGSYGDSKFITPITDTNWSSPVAYNFSDAGYNRLAFYGFTTTTTDATILQVEVLNMRVKRYRIDSTNLSLESDGFIHASFVNSTPNGALDYTFKNNQTAAIRSNVTEWIDTSVGVGKSYSYILTWGFYPHKIHTVDMGSVYIPIDPDLTNRVNTVISDVSNGYGNTITAVRDASGTVLSEARQAKTNSQNASTYASQASTNALNAYNTAQTVSAKIDALATAITNIQNNMGADTSPPVIDLKTVSGARATSGNSIKIVVEVSDNISNTFTYSLNDSSYQPLPVDRVVTVPVCGFGSVPINVWVKDEAGNKSTDVIFIRKL